MASAPVRRSDRVSLTLLLEASGVDSQGQQFTSPARTLLINRHGAVIVLDRNLSAEQRIHLQRRAPSETHRETDVRIVGQFGQQEDGFLYGIELTDSIDLWGVEFPPVAQSPEAVARMLVECSHCRSREVVYLNELELRGFEANRGIARHCKSCGVPTIWTQALHEDEKKLTSRAAHGRIAGRGSQEWRAAPAPESALAHPPHGLRSSGRLGRRARGLRRHFPPGRLFSKQTPL